ncbi:MAG: amidohydrolase [Nitrospinota bacterium]|nr:MAG: amidohydrolase [Nitrospinota bacterium]
MGNGQGGLPVETVLLNANVITIDPQQPRAEAVAIHQGRFVAVERTEEIEGLIGPQTQVIDLSGKTVVPGFIDAHIHVLSSGIRHVMAVDCDLRSLTEIKQALRERAQKTPPGEWVQGFKFDDTKTAENRFLTRQDLDEVSTAHPIFVSHRGGHVYFVNSKAFEVAGITKETPDPPGGKYERDPQSGELTGIILERAAERFRNELLPPVTPADRRAGLRLICQMFNKAGLTSVHDAIVDHTHLQTYQEGLAEGELTLRVYMLIWHTYLDDLRRAGLRTGFGNEMLRIGGIKFVSDGAISGRTAYLSQPYVGSQDDRGILAMQPDELEEGVMRAHEAGFQVCTHANGDAAIEMTLTAYEKALAAAPRPNTRHRIEHCTVVNPRILERMKALGCIATPFCTYIYYHGEKMKYYGEERVEWMFAQRSFLDSGIISTGATDYVPGPYEPLMGIQSCVTRTDSSGKLWGPSQKISVEEALRIYTLHGAYASFEEHLKGSITVGKLADLVVLGADPLTVDPYTIKDIPIEKTMVGGRIVYEA